MISKPLVLALLGAGSLTAAAGGAYLAVRQNATDAAAPAPSVATPAATQPPTPVAETEALVKPSVPSDAQPDLEASRPVKPAEAPGSALSPRTNRSDERRPRSESGSRRPRVEVSDRAVTPANAPASEPIPPPARQDPVPTERVTAPEPPAALPEPQFIEVTVPASSVIGLQVETSISSERARVEDRVEARVTRDVGADGRVAIPAGSRVVGSVTLVDRGGKVKERARLGIRFHTLVFADGTELPIRTEAVYREGESPGRESSAKIGGAAVGGAILGAILGGGKGAVLGGATGAAGGTAAVLAGGRNAATLPSGTIVTVRLSEPVVVEVSKQ